MIITQYETFKEKVSLVNRVQMYLKAHPGENFKDACRALRVDLPTYYNVRGYVRKKARKMTKKELDEYKAIGLTDELTKYGFKNKRKPVGWKEKAKQEKADAKPMPKLEVKEEKPKPRIQVVETVPERKPDIRIECVETPFAAVVGGATGLKMVSVNNGGAKDYREITLKLNHQFFEFLEEQAKRFVVPVEVIASIMLHEKIVARMDRRETELLG